MATDFSRLTVLELRQELKQRNLPQTGKKADLIDRLTAFESEQLEQEQDQKQEAEPIQDESVQEPRETLGSDSHEEPDLPTAPDAEGPQQDTSPTVTSQEQPDSAIQLSITDDAPQQLTDTSTTPIAEFAKPLEELAVAQEQAGDSTIDATVATEPMPTTELIKDVVSRKRRSRSPPPPDTESVAKRPRASEQPAEDVSFEQQIASEPAVQTETGNDAAARDTAHNGYDEHYAPPQEHTRRQSRETTPPHFQERRFDDGDVQMADYDRDVTPAQHPATAALYIKNFMRPLREPVLRDYLVELAAAPGSAPDPDCLVEFYLDQIRTHAYVQFTSISAASRVRAVLHGTTWPNERNRKELWVDFIPEDKVVEWTDRELAEGRGSSARWEVHYEPDDDGIITATLINAAEVAPAPERRNSVRQREPLGPPRPHGPLSARLPRYRRRPLGPRGRGTNHYRQQPAALFPNPPPPMTAPTATTATATTTPTPRPPHFRQPGTAPHNPRAPALVWKPATEETAQRRLAHLKSYITMTAAATWAGRTRSIATRSKAATSLLIVARRRLLGSGRRIARGRGGGWGLGGWW
ncbi:hypothetical protein N0V88_002871 [Collariella sp. IMI 366227]|nr:hypothetical protein N0V88_002871 [Collariella sp. IMI 366227]